MDALKEARDALLRAQRAQDTAETTDSQQTAAAALRVMERSLVEAQAAALVSIAGDLRRIADALEGQRKEES